MNIFAGDILFYVFGALAIIFSLMVVFMRNPVSSAMMMAISFGATAAIMIGLGAHFLGILQILVYAGAIMVLFAFIIMLLNVKAETSPFKRPVSVVMGVVIAALFLGQLIGIIYSLPGAKDCNPCSMQGAEQAWNDLKIGDSQQLPKPAYKQLTVAEVLKKSTAICNDEACEKAQEMQHRRAFACDRILYGIQNQSRTSLLSQAAAVTTPSSATAKNSLIERYAVSSGLRGESDRRITRASLDELFLMLNGTTQSSIALPAIDPKAAAGLYPEGSTIRKQLDNGEFPDTALVGHALFSKYNRALIIAGLALLVATIGVVVLSRRPSGK